MVAKQHEQIIKDTKIGELVLGDGGLLTLINDPSSISAGLLDNIEYSRSDLPVEIRNAIKLQLNEEEVTPLSFTGLINSSFLFKIEADLADIAANAIKLSNYRLRSIESESQLLTTLEGLANTAAVSRNSNLANELRIMVRRYLREKQYTISFSQSIEICLLAAASYIDLYKWRDFVGDWFTELAFGNLDDEGGEIFYANLKYLCHLVPELWASCGKADAALIAYNNK